jgi:glycerate 2-kinase
LRQTSQLLAIASAAVRGCEAGESCAAALPRLGLGSDAVHLFGAGKAAAAMAQAVASVLGARLQSGLVVAKEPYPGFSAGPVELRLAGHPTPDGRSAAAGVALCQQLASLSSGDELIFVLSGGASALIAAPLPPLSLVDLAQATDTMLGAGIPIEELNVVRKHLTRASGGRLAALCPVPAHVLLISDVLGDDLASIGSGPFAPDPSTFAEALFIARRAGVESQVLAQLQRGGDGTIAETPKAGDACFAQVTHHLLASHETLMATLVQQAADAGFARVERIAPVSDDVGAVAERLSLLARTTSAELLLSGGEPTVVLPPSPGAGGRCQQLALLMARALQGPRPASFVAMGSDGSDGPTDAAGAVVDNRSWARMLSHGDPDAAIARADAYPILDAIDALIKTGPTGTNLLDMHLLWQGSA